MTLRGSFIVFSIGTALAWGAWVLILNTVPPRSGGALGELFFFGALFLAITGTLTILGVLGRIRASSALPSVHLGASFRQGALLAIAAVGALLLQRFHILRWWNILLLGGALLMLDLALTRRRRL
jgi:hypothetical protein